MRVAAPALQIALLLFSISAFSIEHDLLVTLDKKQSIISGVLNPGSLSFNGQEIYNGKENFEGLLLNDTPVTITPVSGLKTFYTTTDQTNLELDWLLADGSKKSILKVQYPALTEFKTDTDRVFFKFNEQVASARLDSKEISMQDPIVQVENFKEWLSEIHTLELISDKKTSQIYNLDFRKMRSDLLTTRSLSFFISSGPFSANVKPTAFGLGLRQLNERNISYDVSIMVSRVTYDVGPAASASPVMQRAGQLRGRYGYNPFDTNAGSFSLKRLTFGVQSEIISYVRESLHVMPIDGVNSDKADIWYLQGGPFFRWEPLQYKEWGASLNFDLRIFRTYSDISSDGDNVTLGVSYYF